MFSVWMWETKKCEIHPHCVLQNALHFHHQISKIRDRILQKRSLILLPMGKEAYNLILGPNFVTKQGPKELGGNA